MSVVSRLGRPLRQDRLTLLLLLTCLALMTKVYVMLYDTPEDTPPTPRSSAELLDNPQESSLPLSSASHRSRREASDPESGTRTVYVITATYPRPEQEADLVRLSQTLMHAAPFLFWVVVEDAPQRTPALAELLERSGLRYVHLIAEVPELALPRPRFWGRVPRGVASRNTGLSWVRSHATAGVVYFADDDNSYDIRIFTEIQKTRGVSVFPVGLVTELGVSSPVVIGGQVTDFYDGWHGGRRFPIDMAGFAVSVTLLKQRPNAAMPYRAGYEEDGFLKELGVTREDLQPLADECSQILVWHTRTEKVAPIRPADLNKFQGSNIVALMDHLLPMKA
ncbi:galactosylgalactosylxylosylprotein 3-beta-glucuronosyltransferase P-like [Amphibalanus amphitrite]|uniref:galactosylgalactosylxylosylprotein 3-beta-glucuronosyltransferase P-like n=1 Tax=Amphibalanus amphitrite TaxID=1232801 RepID=UPI001C8FD7E2|nr:galactosylgalactosylxylosylprotein 3-beta-glucuronosyltransferase P-like [Amphibalanus amphitrite]